MAGGPQLASAGTVITEASLLSMKHLSSAPWAALILSLAFASFHPACLAEASSSSNSTLTVHHPGLETLEQCPSKLLLATSLTPGLTLERAGTLKPPCFPLIGIGRLSAWLALLCTDVDFCPQAARCCHTGVDEYGWIAAAVGWSLLFLTLILLCVDKLMKLTPDEPKDLQA
ncbi:hypothetical protein J1605_009536 [Eschrichtius robustus]|uniref:Transmembrane protein 213 n=1 Tax=Eschrichtius robustus TaxID=9764 RepID=A0AB34GS85_ESCRO|nr:hypothetical protein J1605_009536 [Eschrichtius robustus]